MDARISPGMTVGRFCGSKLLIISILRTFQFSKYSEAASSFGDPEANQKAAREVNGFCFVGGLYAPRND